MQIRITEEEWRELARNTLEEDRAFEDITSTLLIDKDSTAEADLIAEDYYVVAGTEASAECFRILDPAAEVVFFVMDGDYCSPNTVIAKVRGKTSAILSAERSALNILSHLSGIATFTRKFVEVAGKYGIEVYDTRKTRPLLRKFEKYAALVGGAKNHRKNLKEAIFIKDNHKRALGGMEKVADALRQAVRNPDIPLIIEVESPEEIELIKEFKPDVILLDNFPPDEITLAVHRYGDEFELEVSGGVTVENLKYLAEIGVKRISTSSIIMKATSASFKLELIGGLR